MVAVVGLENIPPYLARAFIPNQLEELYTVCSAVMLINAYFSKYTYINRVPDWVTLILVHIVLVGAATELSGSG